MNASYIVNNYRGFSKRALEKGLTRRGWEVSGHWSFQGSIRHSQMVVVHNDDDDENGGNNYYGNDGSIREGSRSNSSRSIVVCKCR